MRFESERQNRPAGQQQEGKTRLEELEGDVRNDVATVDGRRERRLRGEKNRAKLKGMSCVTGRRLHSRGKTIESLCRFHGQRDPDVSCCLRSFSFSSFSLKKNFFSSSDAINRETELLAHSAGQMEADERSVDSSRLQEIILLA